jgi:predicted component of type VI protein secretion system
LREDTRKYLVKLTIVYLILLHDLVPEHRAHVAEEVKSLHEILEYRVELAHVCQMNDDETKQRTTLLDAALPSAAI